MDTKLSRNGYSVIKDDISLSNRFKYQINSFKKFPKVGVIGTKFTLIDENGNVLWPIYDLNSIEYMDPGEGYLIKMNTSTAGIPINIIKNGFICLIQKYMINVYLSNYEQ